MSQQPLPASNLRQTLIDNVQGDILGDGFLKQVEFFSFFNIQSPGDFRKKLPQVTPLIANVGAQQAERARVKSEIEKIKTGTDATSQDARDKLVTSKQANIAFTSTGLSKLSNKGQNFPADLGDTSFNNGMQDHAVSVLNDPGTSDGLPNWNPAFLGRQIDGVFLIAANSTDQAEQLRRTLLKILDNTASEVINVIGSARQGQLRRHEHFGYLDGVSEPGVIGFDTIQKDQNSDNREDDNDKALVAPGKFLVKRDGDFSDNRPDWSQDGSFLVFRWLEQRVPEFNKDLGRFAVDLGMANNETNRDIIGARVIGRWKSGALIIDNPNADPMPLSQQAGKTRQQIDAVINVNKHVTFPNNAGICPFGSHIRKVNPRFANDDHRIIRRGIQFGPEVSAKETTDQRTDPANKRGLLFACYASTIDDGFRFIQDSWANSEFFPGPAAGIDPMVGQGVGPGTYDMGALNKDNPSKVVKIPRINPYVITLGGEYFFSPSMTALRTVLADNSKPIPIPIPEPKPGPTPTPVPGGTTVQCFVENFSTGSRRNAAVPIDNKSHKFSELWGNGITGNVVGLNANLPVGVVIQITGNGKTQTLPSNMAPVSVGTSVTDVSNFMIIGQKTS